MGRMYFRLVFLFVCGQALCQSTLITDNTAGVYNRTTEERIFMHTNTQLLFVGEYLYYSLYGIESQTGSPSRISKIAYVELLDEKGNRIFNHKLRLDKGRGSGDYFISASVPSGNYKIIGYTQWSRNCGQDCFFTSDITIINPYQGDQSGLLQKGEHQSDATGSSRLEEQKIERYDTRKNHRFGPLTLKIDGTEFTTRQEVTLAIGRKADVGLESHFSISARKIDTIGLHTNSTAAYFLKTRNTRSKMDRTAIYLPELRGELISGVVLDKSTSKPLKNVQVALSIPGKNYQFQIATTNDKGSFYFNLGQPYSSEEAIVQVIGATSQSCRLSIQVQENVDYSRVAVEKFTLTKAMRALILERSFHHQIENSFFSVKPDSSASIPTVVPFYLDEIVSYDLDLYTRFSTIKETFVELIKDVWISNDTAGKPVFQVRGNPPYFESPLSPLVLIDGVFVQDHQKIVDYNPRKIKRISLGRDRYILGGNIFHGVVDFETFDNDYTLVSNTDAIQKIKRDNPVPKKTYFKQTYHTANSKEAARIPDFRYQLLWLPDVTLVGKKKEVTFFTSDIKGDFEIVLEGFTASGKAITLRETIRVR